MKCLILMTNCVAYDMINLFNSFNISKLEFNNKIRSLVVYNNNMRQDKAKQ